MHVCVHPHTRSRFPNIPFVDGCHLISVDGHFDLFVLFLCYHKTVLHSQKWGVNAESKATCILNVDLLAQVSPSEGRLIHEYQHRNTCHGIPVFELTCCQFKG